MSLRKDGNIINNLKYFSSNGITKQKSTDDSIKKDDYRRLFEEVQRSIPEDRLLILNLKSEWETLCSFLQVPIPEIPFPKVKEDINENVVESQPKQNEVIETSSPPLPEQSEPSQARNFTIPILLLIFAAYGINRRHIHTYLRGGSFHCRKCILFTVKNIFTTTANSVLYYVLNVPLRLGVL